MSTRPCSPSPKIATPPSSPASGAQLPSVGGIGLGLGLAIGLAGPVSAARAAASHSGAATPPPAADPAAPPLPSDRSASPHPWIVRKDPVDLRWSADGMACGQTFGHKPSRLDQIAESVATTSLPTYGYAANAEFPPPCYLNDTRMLGPGSITRISPLGPTKTPLMLAAANGHLEVVKLLLSAKAEVDLPDCNGVTALTMATRNGYTDVVRLLMESGATGAAS